MKIKEYDNKTTEVITKRENPMRKYTNKLDYGLETAKERIELLNSVLYDENGYCVKFFEDMFDQDERDKANKNKSHKEDERKFVNLLPTCSQALSEDIYECKQISRLADYILKAPNQPNMDKQQEYNFYNQVEFDRLLKREELYQGRLDTMNNNTDDFDEGSALAYLGEMTEFPKKNNFSRKRVLRAKYIDKETKMAFLKRMGDNYNLDDSIRITKKDLNDPELAYVKECERQINNIREGMSRKGSDKQRWIYTGMIRSLREIQLEYKNYIKKAISFKQPLRGSTVVDYDEVDMFQKRHILALLNMNPRQISPEDDLSLVLYDLYLLVDKVKIREEDLDIVNKYRNGLSQEEIVEDLGVTQQNVSQILSKLADNVIQEYENIYEDWYYLDRVKGKYKKCSKCEEVKIHSKFTYDITNKRHKSQCKQCISK